MACRVDILRTAVALVHSTPGATLCLQCAGDQVVVAGHGPTADLTPCQLRRVVLAEARTNDDLLVSRIHALSVGGTLEPVGPGIHRATGGATVHHVTSLLGPSLVTAVLQEVGEGGGGRAEVAVRPDGQLGVTCVRLAVCEPDPERLEGISASVAGALLSEEASRSLAGTTTTWHGR